MSTLKYEVTNTQINLTREYSNYGIKVLVNSNSSEKAKENFKKIDDLQINDSIVLTDNYGAMGGGNIVIERIA